MDSALRDHSHHALGQEVGQPGVDSALRDHSHHALGQEVGQPGVDSAMHAVVVQLV